jgi:hypothetical protein
LSDYTKAVRDALKEAGCRFVRHGKGDHDIWWSPIVRRPFVVDGKIKSRHSANETLKDAGLPKRF